MTISLSRSRLVRGVGLAAVALGAAAAAGAQDTVKIDADVIGGLEARSIGPAAMSGRVAALDAVEGDRLTIWVGTAGGGVSRSTDGGLQFKPVFDKHAQSIGAITIDPKNPKTVWVGTGETWARNSVSYGDGVYRSTDGGDNWQRVGLEGSERIAKIAVDPKDPKVVWVGTGESWVRNSASHGDGVYKTTDGGDNWQRLGLEKTERIARIVIDPKDSGTVFVCATGPAYAASAERGLFRTKDAGKRDRRQPARARGHRPARGPRCARGRARQTAAGAKRRRRPLAGLPDPAPRPAPRQGRGGDADAQGRVPERRARAARLGRREWPHRPQPVPHARSG